MGAETQALLVGIEKQLGRDPVRLHVRVGLHTGTPLLSDEGYVGVDVHRGARIAASGQRKGGQMGRRRLATAVLTVVLSAVATVVAATGALADPKTATFTIQLSGAAEVCPTAPGTCGGPGTGTATITIDRNARTLCYTITTQNVALPLLAAHIHEAPVGEAGPVVVPLFTQPVNAATVGPTIQRYITGDLDPTARPHP